MDCAHASPVHAVLELVQTIQTAVQEGPLQQRSQREVSDVGRTKGVASLHHEALDDSVEDDAVVVAVLRVRREVLDGLGALLGEELERDVALGGVHDGPTRQHEGGLLLLAALSRPGVLERGLLIEHIPAARHEAASASCWSCSWFPRLHMA